MDNNDETRNVDSFFFSRKQNRTRKNLKKLFETDDDDDGDDNSGFVLIVERRDMDTLKKIAVVVENLERIVDQLLQSRIARVKFNGNFSRWLKTREKNIQKLQKISKDIRTNRRNCNLKRLFGHLVSLVGGALQIAVLVTAPGTLGATLPLSLIGMAIGMAGSVVAFHAAETERSQLEANVQRAKDIKEDDDFDFDQLGDWLEHEAKLKEELSEILEMEIISDIVPAIKKFIEESMKIDNESKQLIYMEEKIKEIKKIFYKSIPKSVASDVVETLVTLLSAVFITTEHDDDNGYTFECVSMTLKGLFGMVAVLDELVGTFGIISRGTLAPVGAAIDAGGIVLTSVDLFKGSNSPEAEKILALANRLEAEMEVLKQVKEKMKEDMKHSE